MGRLRLKKTELISSIDDNYNDILKGQFEFTIVQTGDYFQLSNLSQKLILRKLNDNLKRLYKEEQSNRRVIIKQVKTLLEETVPMWILKTDIEQFYESIDRSRILSKLRNDSMLSFHSIYIIEQLFKNQILIESTGLPRGLDISSTLSEIYMRRFDRWIQRNPNVYYYARFVDDMIIFSNNEAGLKNVNFEINDHLEIGLTKKQSKTALYNGADIPENRPLEYLGYKFTTEGNGKKKLKVSIANKKIKKIKTRITLAFLDFIKTGDFILLENRIKFLTGNFSIKKNDNGQDLKAGIFYNYTCLTHFHDLHLLNSYYRKLLFSRSNNLGRKLRVKLTDANRSRIVKYSFIYGHRNKVHHPFTIEQMWRIKSCW